MNVDGFLPSSDSGLEAAAAAALPAADDVSVLFSVFTNPNPASPAAHQDAMQKLNFGAVFGDHMGFAAYATAIGWHDQSVRPYGPLPLTPASSVLHYGQEIFEGMKAFRWADSSVWTFRPGFNAARFNHSARRMAMPQIGIDDFLGAIVATVRADERWVPGAADSSLYLRPFMIASESFLGVRAANQFLYVVISTPVGPYFKGGLAPVSIWVSTDFHRAAPGGTGDAKTGGNYASSLLPQGLAAKQGFDQVCYLDAASNTTIEELGGMNVFAALSDGTVVTPSLGTILQGATRSAIIQLLRDRGITVTERAISLDELVAGVADGSVEEMFACGTAAVVTPIGRIAGEEFDVTVQGGPLTKSIYEELTGIQRGTVDDRHGWMYQLV